ncbi:MAG: hypothetical protein HY744_31010 [Deltaproteobacteria bacterium]|nr:hypothetical protein [Deltaproteobacteria bacterium]
MSSSLHSDASSKGVAAAHGVFDPEPTKTLAEGEPHTPAWLPLLGLALFGLAALYALFGGDEDATAAQDGGAAVATDAGAPAPARPALPTGPGQP